MITKVFTVRIAMASHADARKVTIDEVTDALTVGSLLPMSGTFIIFTEYVGSVEDPRPLTGGHPKGGD